MLQRIVRAIQCKLSFPHFDRVCIPIAAVARDRKDVNGDDLEIYWRLRPFTMPTSLMGIN